MARKRRTRRKKGILHLLNPIVKREAKICVRKNGLKCKKIEIKSGAFEKYEIDLDKQSISTILKKIKKMVQKEGYATTIRRLNLLAIWNKNRNPKFARKIKNLMEKLKNLYK